MTKVKVKCYATVICEAEIYVKDADDFEEIADTMEHYLNITQNCQAMDEILSVEEV